MPHRLRFDPKRPLVAARDFTFMGTAYKVGDPFAPEGATDRQRERQYETRAVNFGEAVQEDADPVQMTESDKKHTYLITAPWLEEPERVRGKANAEKRLAEVRAEGAPLGWIDGGSEVTVEGGEGGWYEISAPWLDEPEKVQGREAAEARQLELHEAGAPAQSDDADVTQNADTAADQGDDGASTGDTTGEVSEGADEAGNGETSNQQESDVDKDTERKPEDGDKPNEPGTNQPNGAEVINDHKVAEGATDEEGDEGDGDKSGGVVGP